MSLLHRKSGPERWAKAHPWGEAGSVDYWIEAMHRAYEMGEERAKHQADKLLELQGPQPPREYLDFPDWFWPLWRNHLEPNEYDMKDHPHRMPY